MQFGGGRELSVSFHGIGEGKASIRTTLLMMRDIVRRYKSNPEIVMTARNVISQARLGQKDYIGEIYALHRFVRDSIRYLKDVTNVETLVTPDKLLQIRQGDCDDKSMLLAALLESIGTPSRFIAVGFEPGQYDHVLVQAKVGAGWINLETTEPVPPGWGPPNVRSVFIVKN